jgi:uncharacterized protein YndB with AHSA1/START domain
MGVRQRRKIMNDATAQVSKTIAVAPAIVWRALTNPSSLKQFFFGSDIESDWQVGHSIRMKGEFKGKPYEDKGKILAFDPGKRLSFSHWSALSGAPDAPQNYHVVRFDLAPDGEGTTVTLTQSNLVGGAKPADREHRADYEKNWRGVLDGLAKVVGERA